jgi:hypothetical protein
VQAKKKATAGPPRKTGIKRKTTPAPPRARKPRR